MSSFSDLKHFRFILKHDTLVEIHFVQHLLHKIEPQSCNNYNDVDNKNNIDDYNNIINNKKEDDDNDNINNKKNDDDDDNINTKKK